jgi:hypothetical protein
MKKKIQAVRNVIYMLLIVFIITCIFTLYTYTLYDNILETYNSKSHVDDSIRDSKKLKRK